MHSFHQSRGRIAFDVLCALALAASCAAAWAQTGVSAFLAMSCVAIAYGLVHATALRRQPAVAGVENCETLGDQQGDLLAQLESADRPPRTEAAPSVEVVSIAAPEAPAEKLSPEPARPRSRKKKVSTKAPVTPEAQPEQAGANTATIQYPGLEEEHHPPIAPLFEPQPLVRQQRTVFGRKAG